MLMCGFVLFVQDCPEEDLGRRKMQRVTCYLSPTVSRSDSVPKGKRGKLKPRK